MNPRARRLRRARRHARQRFVKLLACSGIPKGATFHADMDTVTWGSTTIRMDPVRDAKWDVRRANRKATRARMADFIGARIRESLSGSVADPNANTEATRRAVRDHIAGYLATLPERPVCNVTDMVFDAEAGTITTRFEIPTWALQGRLVPAKDT